MVTRKIPFVTGQIYHVFNRSLFKQPIFKTSADYIRFLWLTYLLQFKGKPFSPSHFFQQTTTVRQQMLQILQNIPSMVNILAFCLMPNHYHFIIEQIMDDGITNFISNLQNAYTKYFNIKFEKRGPLFLLPFKGVLIEDDAQLIHVIRYVHLNPYTAFIIKDIKELSSYPWSSLREYTGGTSEIGLPITQIHIFTAFFKDEEDLLQYHYDQADYQRELDRIKHLTLE